MHINHIDIPVPDIAATRDFFLNRLGFVHVATLGRDGLAILKDDHGTVLVLSRVKGFGSLLPNTGSFSAPCWTACASRSRLARRWWRAPTPMCAIRRGFSW